MSAPPQTHYVDPLFAVSPDATTVAVIGAIDIATTHLFEQHVRHALNRKPGCLVLDLSAVTFLSAVGLGVLSRARVIANQQGTVLVLRGTNRRCVAKPLETSGLQSLFLID